MIFDGLRVLRTAFRFTLHPDALVFASWYFSHQVTRRIFLSPKWRF